MKSLKEIISKYNDTDKDSRHSYTDTYDELFTPFRESATDVLEIGVNQGDSIRLWRDYFTQATIHGADHKLRDKLALLENDPRVQLHIGPAYEDSFLETFKGKSFDIIIDDGSHKARHMKYVVSNYFQFLKPGGVMVIEDIKKGSQWKPKKKSNTFLVDRLPEGVTGRFIKTSPKYNSVLFVAYNK